MVANPINAAGTGFISYDENGNFVGRTFVGGGNILITNVDGVAGNAGFTVIGGGFIWTNVTGTSQTLFARQAFVANNNSTRIDFNVGGLSFGDAFKIIGNGSAGWRLNANGGSKTIRMGTLVCTTATGYIESTNRYDCVEMCSISATEVLVISSLGNITVV